MLIDDNKVDNFFHERIIKKNDAADTIVVKESGEEALTYLNTNTNLKPDVILLDINMPGMSGWDFIEEYIEQNHHLPTCNCSIVLLISEHQSLENDILKLAEEKNVFIALKNKPVTHEVLNDIVTSKLK
ncbi:response regulator [Flavobacterium suaedae]|uniref:Response regulator n=2 Tax=Flavobacterium suaedae TaxID=1767027 RepID=A0ABQ1K1E0_9FLAO|nr:response regulator [Flavobacterium suaedae]